MQKTILYPIEFPCESNKHTYLRALRLARRLKARLVLFTALPSSSSEEEMDRVYLHLLELDGHHRTHLTRWQASSVVSIQRVIQKGEFRELLREYLLRLKADYLVCQPHSRLLNGSAISHWLNLGPYPALVN